MRLLVASVRAEDGRVVDHPVRHGLRHVGGARWDGAADSVTGSRCRRYGSRNGPPPSNYFGSTFKHALPHGILFSIFKNFNGEHLIQHAVSDGHSTLIAETSALIT
jgi:hypothetical protein